MRVFLGIVALFLAVAGQAEAEPIFQTVNVPGAASTEVTGVSESGNEITGSFMLTPSAPSQGFLLRQDTNQFQTVNVPGAASTKVEGVSANGNEITGSYMLTQSGPAQGFVLMRDTNQFQTVNVPGAASTVVTGVSESGNAITGSYMLTQGGPAQGFILMRDTNQTLTVNVPGAASTNVEAISANGNEITGSYALTQDGPRQGFVATSVPEASTLVLMVSGVLGMAAYAKRVGGGATRTGLRGSRPGNLGADCLARAAGPSARSPFQHGTRGRSARLRTGAAPGARAPCGSSPHSRG